MVMELFSRLKVLSLVLLCALSAGCALFSSPEPAPPAPTYSQVEQFIIDRTPGGPDSTGTVSDPGFGENLRIVLEKEYTSAAGETCRVASLFSPRGETEVIVMCRDVSGRWNMTPRVWGMGLTPPATPPAETPAETPEKQEPGAASPPLPS